MNELVKVKIEVIGDEYVRAVSARELHTVLQSKQDFTTWIKNRINKYDFIDDVDYLLHKKMEQVAHQGGTRSVEKFDYFLSLDMAKELSMVENNEQGKLARKYFIECEKRLKDATEQANQKYIYRQIAREEAYPMLDAYDECARENNVKVSNYDHSSEFDMLNVIVLGKTAQGYKYENVIPLHESSIRDYLSPTQLEAIAFLQNANTLMLEEGELDRNVRKERLQRLCDKKFKLKLERDLLRLQS